jgi:hypothetical protein
MTHPETRGAFLSIQIDSNANSRNPNWQISPCKLLSKGFLMGAALSRASDLTCSDWGLSAIMPASLHQSTLLHAGHMLTRVYYLRKKRAHADVQSLLSAYSGNAIHLVAQETIAHAA